MISFGMSEEQELVRDTMREFARDELRPRGRECDEESSIPEDLLQAVWDLGLTSTQIPAAYGGGDEPRSMVTNAILLEELAHGDPALAVRECHSRPRHGGAEEEVPPALLHGAFPCRFVGDRGAGSAQRASCPADRGRGEGRWMGAFGLEILRGLR